MAEGQQTLEEQVHQHRNNTSDKKHMAPSPQYSPSNSKRSGEGGQGYGSSVAKIIVIILLLLGATALTLWLIYRPHNPRFSVVSAAIYNLSATSPPFITASMQFTIVARNPNRRVDIIYDNLSVYVSYRNQQITPPVSLPPLHHETKTTVAMSPVMGGGGTPVPVSPEVVNGLVMDASYGVVSLRVVLRGRLRWKAGGVKTKRYGVYVSCDVWVGLKKGFAGQVPLLASPPCHVHI